MKVSNLVEYDTRREAVEIKGKSSYYAKGQMRFVRWYVVLFALFLACWPAGSAQSQEEDAEPPANPSTSRAAKLAEDFNDPLTTLPQLFIQDAYTPSNYGTEAPTNKVIFRAIVPRIPKYSLFPLVQLVRPSFSVVTVPTGRGGETRTAFGDMQLFDLAVIPWPSRDTGLYMGVGPIFVFPTASDKAAGQGAWQIGPAFGAIYNKIPGILLGGLIQNPVSFAYTSPDRQPLNTFFAQPIVLVYLGKGFYAKSADSTWSVAWHHGQPTMIPLSFGIGYVLLSEGWPPFNFFVSGEWMAYRQDAPVSPQSTVRFGVTIPFPGWKPWN